MKLMQIILSAAVMAFALWLLGAQVPFMTAIASAAIVAAPLAYVAHRTFRKPQLVGFANVAEGVTLTGRFSKLATTAIATSYLLGKRGADALHVSACGANDVPWCVIQDQAEAADDPVQCDALGGSPPSLMIASEAIAEDAEVYTAAGGKIQDLPVVAGTYYKVGRAQGPASADGDPVLVVHCVPVAVTVT